MAPSSLYLLAPPFDQIRDEHYLPAFEKGMQLQNEQVRAIADNPEAPTFANTIEALERTGEVLFRVSKVFFNLSESTTSERLQSIEAEIAPKLAQHSDGIYLDGPLYARVKALFDQRETLELEPESARLLERYHTMFVRAGAQLDDDAKTKLMALNEEESKLTTQFQDNLLKDTNASAVLVDGVEALAGLDASAISAAAEAAREMGHEGMYALTLQSPSSQGVLATLEERELRKLVFEASTNRGNNDNAFDNKAIVRRLAQLRAQQAALLGYPDHASFVLEDQMAATAAAVNQMLGELAPQILAKAKAEAAAMQAWIDEQGIELTLEPWDWAFYAEKLRKARYDLDESQIRPYFELNRVLEDGLFMMARELYGITFAERKDLPVYHPDVRVFEVREADGGTVGLFYVDYFARPSKRGGAWMDSFVDQSELLGTKAVVVNVMNIPKPAEGEPALLSFDEVSTLFHEFGHAAHGLFSQVRYPMLSGTNVPRDFVEL
jgi:peptidyl-dipeptidase Dcp